MSAPRSAARFLRHAAAALAAAALAFVPTAAGAEKIKDLASIQGVRANQLVGYGVVVGLDGSGDQTTQAPFTAQSIISMLGQLGVQLPPEIRPQLRNAAAVMITAQLPPFAQPGQQIDVTVSSLGNAKSLRGGTLILAPLKGADGQVYALAQGNVVVGGAGASRGGSSVQVNHLSAGRVPGGATVERAVPSAALDGQFIQLELKDGDFSTARSVAEAINARVPGAAQALDARVIRVRPPEGFDRVGFMADIETIDVTRAAPMARVIVNARTGSIVMNQAVTLSQAAVAHGNLSVSITSRPSVSQPGPLSGGSTVVTERADIEIRQESGALMMVEGSTKLSDVVTALNALGASSQDLIAILQALKAAGSLKAELEII